MTSTRFFICSGWRLFFGAKKVPLLRNCLFLLFFLTSTRICLASDPAIPVPKASADAADATRQRMKGLMERIFSNSTGIRTKFDTSPNKFLVESLENVPPGTALDVGMGQGRNALYLARRGWDVTGFDLSASGIRQALDAAKRENLHVNAIVASDEEFNFGVEKWDLIVVSYVEFRHFADRIRRSLKPGGLVVAEYYHRDTRKYRAITDTKGFGDNELLRLFADFRILRYEDVAARPDWNFEGDEKQRVVRLLAKKNDPKEPVACYRGGKTYGDGQEACSDGNRMKCGQTGWKRLGTCK